VVDDPYDYGSIAAANSLSDIYAMNGRPLFALNICCFPRKHPASLWHQVLRGGTDKAIEAGIPIVGGHTVDDPEPKYGLVVTGLVDPKNYWTNEGARAGDALVLTKPIGTGLITTMLKSGIIELNLAQDAIESMKTLNRTPAQILSQFEVHACTDITGNGLIGHASEIAEASGVGMDFTLAAIPFFSAARKFADTGKFPGGTYSNEQYFGHLVDAAPEVPPHMLMLLYDAQTSGGLLSVLPAEQADEAVSRLRAAGVNSAARIGAVIAEPRIRIHP